MKRLMLALVAASAGLFGQCCTENIFVWHQDGVNGTAAHLVNGSTSGNQYFLPTGSGYAQFPLTRVDMVVGVSTTLSGVKIPLGSSITGGSSSQSINVTSTVGICDGTTCSGYWGPQDYLCIGCGTANQEVVSVIAVVDASHFTAIAKNNHTTSEFVTKIFHAYSKFLQANMANISTGPTPSITNVNFIRLNSLPSNAYDQYKLQQNTSACSYVQDDVVPWTSSPSSGAVPAPMTQYSSGSVSSTGNPTNGILVNSGPIATSGIMFPCVQIQVLSMVDPEPSFAGTQYAYWWDNGNQ